MPGELELIQRIRRRAGARGGRTGARRELQLGIGDDCAILRPRRGEEIVVTTDFSLEGRHFRRDWHSAEVIGHRTLARGLSDLAAMGARPVAAFLSLALPRVVAGDPQWLDRFLDGFSALADRFAVPLAGGDTAEAPGAEVLADIVLLGAVPQGLALRRDRARAGDRLFCTGTLGGSAAELEMIAAGETQRAEGLVGAKSTKAVQRGSGESSPELRATAHPHFFPEPRLVAGQMLVRRGLAKAAIDLSDGLSTDLRHLCEASGVAAEVEAQRLPLHSLTGQRTSEASRELALHGGEDYQLLFTARPGVRVPRRLGGVAVTEIGRIVERRPRRPVVVLVDADGRRTELVRGGWEHLR